MFGYFLKSVAMFWVLCLSINVFSAGVIPEGYPQNGQAVRIMSIDTVNYTLETSGYIFEVSRNVYIRSKDGKKKYLNEINRRATAVIVVDDKQQITQIWEMPDSLFKDY
ncbi:hypothetical Protein YC6258_05392 [Gynuella sunshinyii YC6258]|uniref:Uncharacterized protein n=2 Tax=Gynuella sunshinyii TaxID=1445505 RepID=A0A0C5VRZ8_9GAMM|nr:hypothetical Protein YC6258_05392 [Gynuella sunshinyii YC6258]